MTDNAEYLQRFLDLSEYKSAEGYRACSQGWNAAQILIFRDLLLIPEIKELLHTSDFLSERLSFLSTFIYDAYSTAPIDKIDDDEDYDIIPYIVRLVNPPEFLVEIKDILFDQESKVNE